MMKKSLEQALAGKSLRNDIFTAIGHRSMHSLSALLRRSRQRDSRYLPYSSQHSLLHAESPIRRADLSQPLATSPQPHKEKQLLPKRKISSVQQGKQGAVQRMKGKQVSSKCKNKSGGKRRKAESKGSPDSHSRPQKQTSSPSKRAHDSRGKSSTSRPSRSPSSRPHRLDLSSILDPHQRLSASRTPSRNTRKDRSRPSADRTHKKGRREGEVSSSVWRKVDRLCREPGKFVRMLKSETASVRVRVQRRRILEVEVTTHRPLETLTIVLERGNLDCQHIEEHYTALPTGSRLALFSCVRSLDLDHPTTFPRLLLTSDHLERRLLLPYSWLLFATPARPQPRSRIVTKACLQQAAVDPQRLRTLTQTLPGWISRHKRGESVVRCECAVGEEGVCVQVRESGGTWAVEAVGRGEGRLQGLLGFLAAFLRP